MKFLLLVVLILAPINSLQAQFLRDRDQKILKSYMPANDFLDSIKEKIKFYELEKVYQNEGLHAVSYNISARKPIEPYGNANIEFPWGETAGLEHINNNNNYVTSYKFVSLPEDKPIIYWRANLRDNPIQWRYPSGTVFGELLMMKYQDKSYVFEVRTRVRGDKSWAVQIYRPFSDYEEFQDALDEPMNSKNGKLRFIKNLHPIRIINREYIEEKLPYIEPELVKKLLDRKFKPIHEWSENCFAPTTDQEFSIIPKNYNAGYLKPDNKSCMACHNTCGNIHTFDLQPGRDWYGYVRGSDGIFSFHIFDPRVVSHNGVNVGFRFNENLFLRPRQ